MLIFYFVYCEKFRKGFFFLFFNSVIDFVIVFRGGGLMVLFKNFLMFLSLRSLMVRVSL